MASMRNWLKAKEGRVVVVHCKAGKGRSGTASCSYLISEEGWEVERALKRFTERRMRPGMGKGVSIPSQLRWIQYVDRWKYEKIYVERQAEVLEVHCWGLRDGVKIQVEGFVDNGKKIKTFHTFTSKEREIVRGEIEAGGGIVSVVSEIIDKNGIGRSQSKRETKSAPMVSPEESTGKLRPASTYPVAGIDTVDGATAAKEEDPPDQGTGDVVFRPSKRIVLPTNDINIDVERRNNAAFDLTYVTAVAHVWFNAYFEGNGPEQGGDAEESGVFEITWDAMDGIKGSSRKGIPAFDKIAVVWRTIKPEGKPGIIITEPKEGEEVPQSTPADWHGEDSVEPSEGKDLGLRTSSPPDSETNVSKASSIKSNKSNSNQKKAVLAAPGPQEDSTQGVRSHGPNGEEIIECPVEGTEEGWTGDGTARHGHAPGSTPDGVKGIINVCTGDLPDGKPEDEMKDAKDHALFHLGKKKSTSS